MSPWLQDNVNIRGIKDGKQGRYRKLAWSRSIFRFSIYLATAVLLAAFTVNGIIRGANIWLIVFSCVMVAWLGLYAWYASRWLRPRSLYKYYYPRIRTRQKWDIDQLADELGRSRYFVIQDLRVLHSNGFLPGADLDPRCLTLHCKLPEPQ